MITTITIDMDRKCAECRKPGPAESGICLGCANKAMRGLRMKSAEGRAAQARWRKYVSEANAARLSGLTLAVLATEGGAT